MSDILTLKLEGEVTLPDFAAAMTHLHGIVGKLSAKIPGSEGVEWIVYDLAAGSATAALRGRGRAEIVDLLVRSYEGMAVDLEAGRIADLPPDIAQEAIQLTHILNGKVTGIHFETDRVDALIRHRIEQTTTVDLLQISPPEKIQAYGAVEGKVQTLESRGGLRFTLYDTLYDRAVGCYVEKGYEDVMREIWGRLAIVEGMVRRDAETGRPLTIRGVRKIEVIPEGEPGAYRRARGALPSNSKELPEAILRRLRDV